jgi:hypothetical protein
MPNMLELYNKAITPEQNNQSTEAPQEHSEMLDQQPDAVQMSGNPTNDPNELKNREDAAVTEQMLGGGSSQPKKELRAGEDSWSPEYTTRGFLEETGTSVLRGIGKHIIGGTGDLIQVAGSVIPGVDIGKGNMISRALQESGAEMTENFQSMIPEELLHENLTLGSMMNPKFWSTHAAEMIPQIAEFILLSKGGASAAKKAASGVLKHAPGVTRTATGAPGVGEIFGSGKFLGKIATDQGLTALGSGMVGAVGGGITGNVFSGMLNAAQVVNENKDLVDAQGNKVFSEDDLSAMAGATMRNNAAWLAADIASWGMTYGGGWKALKGMNPIAKGGKVTTASQRAKVASTGFKYDVAPLVKNMTKLAGKAGAEGLEETFQETFEEWSAKKAVASQTGFFSDGLGDVPEFFDFYMSKENRGTIVLSAAMGAMGGGAFNIKDLFNKKAEQSHNTWNRIENLTNIVDKQGTEEELNWQEFHIQQTIADIVVDDKVELYQDFANKLVKNGNITEDEKAYYDQMLEGFQEAKSKGERLNIKGKDALMKNFSAEMYATKMIEQFQVSAKEKIDAVNQTGHAENVKAKKIAEIEAGFQKQLQAASILKAEAIQNQENLIIGKRANPLEVDHQLDEYGNELIFAGLTQADYESFTEEGGKNKKSKLDNLKDKAKSYKLPNTSSLSKRTRELVNTIKAPFMKAEEQTEEGKAEASGTTEVNGKAVQTPKSPEQASQEAEQMAEEATVDPNETVDNDVYNKFKDEGVIDQQTINDIAESIHDKGSLTERQEEIRSKNPDAIKEAIAKILLDTTSTDTEANKASLRDVEIQENQEEDEDAEEDTEINDKDLKESEKEFLKGESKIQKQFDKIEKEAKETFDKAEKAYRQAVKDAKDSKEYDKAHEEFKKARQTFKDAMKTTQAKSIKSVIDKNLDKAKSAFSVSSKRIKKAKKHFGFDKRGDSQQQKNVFNKNMLQHKLTTTFLEKARTLKNSDSEFVSQNELDAYLNQFSNLNLKGPNDIHKMAVVNHQLKRMFPDANGPTQVLIVKNMYSSIGSIGVGHAMAGTIYVDSKSWHQDEVFMHELAHIYYGLGKEEEEVQNILKSALKNDELVEKIKQKYDDYTLIYVKDPNTNKFKVLRKGPYLQLLAEQGVDKNMLGEAVEHGIAAGNIKEIPMHQQKYLKEELFVSMLEGPLAKTFDKVFKPKNEPKRQRDVKKFWGLIRKKGAIIESDNAVETMLRELNDGKALPSGDLKEHIFKTFSAVTEGVRIDSFGMDARQDELTQEMLDAIEDIKARKKESLEYVPDEFETLTQEDAIDEYEDNLEDGPAFYENDYNSRVKGATRILKRFGAVYNKSLRVNFLNKNKGKDVIFSQDEMFDRDGFESVIYGLATENASANHFIYHIENSALKEVQAFNRFLNKVHPKTKMNLLNSMHFVFSNSAHVSGFRNVIKPDGSYDYVNSMSQAELNKAENIISRLGEELSNKANERGSKLREAITNIRENRTEKSDILTILESLTDRSIKLDKILEQGYVSYQGKNIPIDTLVTGFVQREMFAFVKKDGTVAKGTVSAFRARPLIEAIINTNRKFSPLSSVKNAEGNMEPVRIVNNHLTKEVDNMVEFLKGDAQGNKPDLDAFLDRFSHLAHKGQNKGVGKYVPNSFLVNIYNNYQNGFLPQISQYHGLEGQNANSSLFKNSTALEQGIEDFLIFSKSARNSNGKKNKEYLGSMGAFSDSPRKFFMNMKRIDISDAFDLKTKQFKGDYINMIFNTQLAMDPNGTMLNTKKKVKQYVLDAIKEERAFINENAREIAQLPHMNDYFSTDSKGKLKLNKAGVALSTEFTLSSIANGYNIADTFLPGVKGSGVVKRMKMNSSPVLSVNNPNFKLEPLFFADELVGNSIAGTDSGMYILEEDAVKLQNLGKGVFDMNNGFKLLNASIEKDNKEFKGKAAYLKGYTTIIKEGHPLHAAMKLRKEKYNAYHLEKFGVEPSDDLSDGSHNHMVIAIPQSSDKNGFFPTQFLEDKKGDDGKALKDENGEVIQQYTADGELMTPEYLKDDPEHVNAAQDKYYYDANGDFVGISTYNFGPQQLMDKTTNEVNTPVQMVNSIIVNATLNGEIEKATKIQRLISEQKRAKLTEVLEKIKSHSIEDYKTLIMEGLNREDMNQAQRILLEDGASIGLPYVNEIAVNQLAKTIRKMGNKLSTPGTLAHQVPDIGFEVSADGSVDPRLKGYGKNGDGSSSPAEMVAPGHMEGKVKAREELTIYTKEDELNRIAKDRGQKYSLDEELASLKRLAIKKAKRRAMDETGDANNYPKFMGETRNKNNDLIGYHVKGDTVIASRVPGHGPSSTGIFEIVAFNSSAGNQVMVSGEFNDIIGSDNDGDALFIQTKGDKKEFSKWNEAFDLMSQYWLSPQMREQVQTKMIFEEETKAVVEKLGIEKDKESMPFSPAQRRKDYNNTMVSKRNVGPIFNTHKIANMLAAYEVGTSRPIKIGNKSYNGFADTGIGIKSRNQQSAILANIILDNSKHHFADALGLDENNVGQAILMVNMGIPLEQVARILNSPAAKMWTNLKRSNNSLFHGVRKESTIIDNMYKEFGGKKRDKNMPLDITMSKVNEKSQQLAIVELFSYLSGMNKEVQRISKIMTGHKSVHVNPLVLEKQIADFEEVITGKMDGQSLNINEGFKTNPDMQNYLDVARATLEHTKNLNPVYRNATNKVLSTLSEKIGNIGVNEIERISKDLSMFNTSRLIGLNNTDTKYVKDLMDPSSKTSIFKKLQYHLDNLGADMEINKNDALDSVSKLNSNILFSKALNYSLYGNSHYISANTSFVNDSFNKEEREAAQREFERLPTPLQNDLILYDMITHGWKSPQSMAPLFGRDINSEMSFRANIDINEKNGDISEKVLEQLEKIIVLKTALNKSNPLPKVRLDKKNKAVHVDDVNQVPTLILKNPEIYNKVSKGKPAYVQVINGKYSEVWEIPAATVAEINAAQASRSKRMGRDYLAGIALEKMQVVPNNLTKIGGKYMPNFDLSMIGDKNGLTPYKTTRTEEENAPINKAAISYEEAHRKAMESKGREDYTGMDAREDFDVELFTKKKALTKQEFEQAMEFNKLTSRNVKDAAYNEYLKQKGEANNEYDKIIKELDNKTQEELLDMYQKYGEKDVYAYSIIVTPIIKKLALELASDQAKLFKDKGVEGGGFDGNDVSNFKAWMMSGSTIPSNHPSAQAMARLMEREYKNFINEKKKYISEMNKVSEALYKEKLNYGNNRYINLFKRIKNAIFSNSTEVYEKLYGNMVIRNEVVDADGKVTFDFKLRPQKEMEQMFKDGSITQAEKDFYDFFKKTTNELMPAKLKKKKKEDYIPHTSMSTFESMSARGLLGMMINSRSEDDALYDVKMNFKDANGNEKLMSFKQIEDTFKMNAARGGKNSISKMVEYRRARLKAKKLLRSGKNENGTPILYGQVSVETALGFGAVNRFANERSVKATELPSMDLNKALGDYVHATLFVNGNGKFKGMERLQGYVDGVLAFNRENNLPNINEHVQKVWKDYFIKGKRQTSFLGKKGDKVVSALTRMNLFYALGYSANKNTGGLYVVGNILVGKYHNIKDIGGKAWIRGEAKYWGLDSLEGGISGITKRHKRMAGIMKSMNFMEINVYDEVNMEKKQGIDSVISDIALMPMVQSEKWIQQVHMIGLLTDEELELFDETGKYKDENNTISNDRLIELEDQVKSQHGRGYQPTDQRAIQMYSWGNMMLQFSKFLPTMVHDRFGKKDVNIYGRETIGSLRAVSDMVRYVVNNPKDYVRYRASLSDEERRRLDSGLKGMALSAVIGLGGVAVASDTANDLFWDANYYMNHSKLSNKMVPAAIQSTHNLVGGLF